VMALDRHSLVAPPPPLQQLFFCAACDAVFSFGCKRGLSHYLGQPLITQQQ
jgi:hypothetical protein